ncbi:MAG: branched-chain amino acid ABC transporter permease, partial [Syntrophales bacterium LBB04]|nr:branched-chain amino acid ABC transporter permease [Syntrophales bacterium LBB04]
MDFIYSIVPAGVLSQFLVGLSRTTILFIVASGLSLILGVLRIPNIAHGSLYMIGAFAAFTVTNFFGGGSTGFWMALILAPIFVAFISFVAERGVFQYLYEREHLMLILLTFAFSLVFGDLVKIVWGEEYKSVPVPPMLQGFAPLFGGLPFPLYNLFLLVCGPVIAILLWLLVNKTKIGKIARAAAVDREMIGAVGVNVSWVFATMFVIGCLLAGLGGVLVAPTVSVTLGMDHTLIIE